MPEDSLSSPYKIKLSTTTSYTPSSYPHDISSLTLNSRFTLPETRLYQMHPKSTMSVGRKVFHCVVDDTALTANVGEIKKWTSQGAITLIVPLYSMCRKDGSSRL